MKEKGKGKRRGERWRWRRSSAADVIAKALTKRERARARAAQNDLDSLKDLKGRFFCSHTLLLSHTPCPHHLLSFPSPQEFSRALSCVQPEEATRICRFHFANDARSSLVRLGLAPRTAQCGAVQRADPPVHPASAPTPHTAPGRTSSHQARAKPALRRRICPPSETDEDRQRQTGCRTACRPARGHHAAAALQCLARGRPAALCAAPCAPRRALPALLQSPCAQPAAPALGPLCRPGRRLLPAARRGRCRCAAAGRP